MFQKILIANRGEIACRVIKTARRLGVATVAVYSDTDATARHVREADEAWPLGGDSAASSYLNQDKILEIAKQSGAEGIHPGYGFLSENAGFARACEAAGIAFIGPTAETIDAMGSKAAAKALMVEADVPVVPGYHGEDQDETTLKAKAEEIGFPLMIKAAAGGGGKGMRIVQTADDFAEALESACREARNAFGDDRVIMERFLPRPKHIEFQVFADSQGHTIHLGERECSVQRRYQKIIEETPSPELDDKLRQQMGEAAVAAAKAVNYRGAGTVEFIFMDGEFFFMEMNTRLQVEHPVTEMVTGQDLVEWQLRVAAGEPLTLKQDDVRFDGHAIEVRLYAEDPQAGFLPASGRIDALTLPEQLARIDSGVTSGDFVSVHYDPMIAKLIVHAEDRPAALTKLRAALGHSHVAGLRSNLGFLQQLCAHPRVIDGTIDTGYLDRHLDEVLQAGNDQRDTARLAVAAAALQAEEQRQRATNETTPWTQADGWRLGQHEPRQLILVDNDTDVAYQATGYAGAYTLGHEGSEHGVQLTGEGLTRTLYLGGKRTPVLLWPHGREWEVVLDGLRFAFTVKDPAEDMAGGEAGEDDVRAPMPATVIAVKVKAGDSVTAGQALLVIEAMKMEITLKAPFDGVVDELPFGEGDFVEADTLLAHITPAEAQA
jgi:3-methylcrotonyl-CoA carboxylase alpha subunit